MTSIAPCKGIQDSLGFWIPCCGFRIPGTGFRIPKRAGFHFFPGFNAFLRTSFSCSNLAILKDFVRRHNKFVFFFDLQNYGRNILQFRKGFWYNNEGDIGGLSTPQHRGKKITNTPLPQKTWRNTDIEILNFVLRLI